MKNSFLKVSFNALVLSTLAACGGRPGDGKDCSAELKSSTNGMQNQIYAIEALSSGSVNGIDPNTKVTINNKLDALEADIKKFENEDGCTMSGNGDRKVIFNASEGLEGIEEAREKINK